MMSVGLFALLPDELWLTIFHDWVNHYVILCAFDIALCNRSFRSRYLALFEKYSSIIFSSNNVHFQVKAPLFGFPKGFCDWCLKRKIYPTSVVYEGTMNKIGLDALKNVEALKIHCCDIWETFLAFDPLNAFPQLKVLKLDLGYRILKFGCGPSQLMQLELIRFPSYQGIIETLVTSCPLLEVVRIVSCSWFKFTHVKYLMDHASRIRSILAEKLLHEPIMSILFPQQNVQAFSASMKQLEVRGVIGSLFLSRDIRTALKKCPELEEVALSIDDEDCEITRSFLRNHFEEYFNEWCEVITSSWQHLRSLEVSHGTWMLSHPSILQSLHNTCGKTLRKLYLSGREISENTLRAICQGFVNLESLELYGTTTSLFYYSAFTVTQWFRRAVFRNTLHTLKCNRIGCPLICYDIELDYADWLACFPALQTVGLLEISCCKRTILRQAFPAMEQIKELYLQNDDDNDVISSCACATKWLTADVMIRFVQLQTLTMSYIFLTPWLLRTVFMLPHLTYLSLLDSNCNLYHQHHTHYTIRALFHPNNYPMLVCPLKQFKIAYSKESFPEDLLRFFLLRFVISSFFSSSSSSSSSLESCQLQKVDMSYAMFHALQREYRFRVVIQASSCCEAHAK